MYEINKNVPIPAKNREPGCTKYPFAKMEVGDSFLANTKQTTICNAAKGFEHRHGGAYKFATRVEGDCVRIWRIA